MKQKVSLVSEVGNWVQGDRFWGRQREVVELRELLRNGANVAIAAPRRIGKTSLMREVAQQLEQEFVAIHVDLQGASTPEDLVVELAVAGNEHRELRNRVFDVFRNAIGGLEHIQARELAVQIRSSAAADWQSKANRLLDEYAECTPPVVIYIDELAILVNRMLKGHDYTLTPERVAAVDRLMSWLRQASIRYTRKLRFVLASSIGLAPVLAQAKLSATLNTFTSFHLPPWDRDTARNALIALANHESLAWADGAPESVLDRLGIYVPHHVQVFWRILRDDARRRNVSTTLGIHLAKLAMDLLSEAAIAGALSLHDARRLADGFDGQQLREVVDVLVHDGYLQSDAEKFEFSNKLLRDWWSARHRLTHRPLAERGVA